MLGHFKDGHTTTDEAEQSANVVIESWIRQLEGMNETEILQEIKKACINNEAQKICDDIFKELSGKPVHVIVT